MQCASDVWAKSIRRTSGVLGYFRDRLGLSPRREAPSDRAEMRRDLGEFCFFANSKPNRVMSGKVEVR